MATINTSYKNPSKNQHKPFLSSDA